MVIHNYRQSSISFDARGIRTGTEEILYYTGLVLWLTQIYISKTIFADFFGGRLVTAVRYFCMLIFLLKILLSEKTLQRKAAAVFITAAAVFVVVQQNINTGMPLIQILLLVYGAKGLSFRRTCKVILWSCVFLWSVPVLLDKTGIYEVSLFNYKDRVREFLNFNYVSFAAIYFNNIVFCALYAYTDPDRRGSGGNYAARREVSWPVLILLTAAEIWLFAITDTSLPFAVGMLYIAMYVLIIKLRLFTIRNTSISRTLSVLIFPVLAYAAYKTALVYNWRNPRMKMIDDLTHSRISLAHQGLVRYGVHLFGIQIAENTDTTKGTYFYIDSGYIKNLINYGLIVLIVILLYYSVILYAAVVEHDVMLAVWLICIALYSAFNNLLLSPGENGSMFAIWYAIELLKWRKKKRKRKRIMKREQLEHAA